MTQRLDKLVVSRGLTSTRERAQALILAGRILVDEQKVDKPGASVAEHAVLRLLGEDLRYVSRGGLKLERALAHWGIALDGRACLDIGASTGGFTDCMLQHGAGSVLAVDTGWGQIHQSLRADPRVTLLERTNARKLTTNELVGVGSNPTFLAMDVSFISATLLLPAVLAAAPATTEAVILVKPQFEAGREHVGAGGIVRDPSAHLLAIDRVRLAVLTLRGIGLEIIESPIHGAEGNIEFLLHAHFPPRDRLH